MPADKPTELSRIKQKLELDRPSLWSASIQPTRPHSRLALAPGAAYIHTYIHTCMHTYMHACMHACIHTYIHTCLLLISMLWHRQAIFESKGDKLSSSAEGRIRTHQGLRHQIASRLNARWQTDWAIEDQAKNLNSTARPYDQQAFSPLDPNSRLAFAPGSGDIHVVNFDALAQASDIRIYRRQVVFLCWRQDSNPSRSQTPNRQQTECPLTNRLSYRGSS